MVRGRTLATAGAAFCLLGGVADAQQVVAIRASRLIDGSGAPPVNAVVILVEGDRIRQVGPASSVTVPSGATLIDLTGFTVLPGLIDTHVHITGMPGDGGDTQTLRETEAHKAIYGVVNARITLEAGFTAIRDVGAGDYSTVALRDSIHKGLVPGPRMFVATRGIGMTGGHGDINGWSPALALPGAVQIVDGVDPLRKAVREQIKFGADLIKLVASGGVLSVGDAVNTQQYSFEEMKAVVDEAARSNRKVAAHAHGTVAIREAARAGVASIEHGSLVDDEGIRIMKEKGTYLVPSLYTLEFIIDEGSQHGVPAYGIEKAKQVAVVQRENIRRAYQAGVRFAYGTDAAVFPHGRNARDFAILVRDIGVPPLEAVRMATSAAAELIGVADKVGTVKAGLWADLIAVEGDPVADIRKLEDVRFVMKGGSVVKAPPGRR